MKCPSGKKQKGGLCLVCLRIRFINWVSRKQPQNSVRADRKTPKKQKKREKVRKEEKKEEEEKKKRTKMLIYKSRSRGDN